MPWQTASRDVLNLLLVYRIIKMMPPRKPTRSKSGLLTPIYFDGRVLVGDKGARSLVLPLYLQNFRDFLMTEIRLKEWPIIAGVATGAIPMSAMVADRLRLEYCYVRAQPKDHGTRSQVEGAVVAGRRPVILMEDVVMRATSSGSAIRALQREGAQVVCILSHFSFDLPESAREFRDLGVPHYSLIPFNHFRDAMPGHFSRSEMDTVREWHADPERWTKKMEERYPKLRDKAA